MKAIKLYPAVVVLGIAFLLIESVFWASEQKQPLEVAVRMILLRTSEEARQVLANLQRGEDFAELAKKHSIDSTGPAGGYLGKVKLSDLRPEIQEALKGLAAGQVSGVVETSGGYMILKVLEEAESAEIESAQRTPESRLTTDISGGGVVKDLFDRTQKPVGWEQDLQTICAVKRMAVRNGLIQSKDNNTLAQLWVYQGELGRAVKYFQAVYEQAVVRGDKQVLLELEEVLVIAHMRLAEVENRVPSARAKTCMFPMLGGAQPEQMANWEAAIRHFLKFLEQQPEDLEVRWLLNLVSMALGRYPEAVPKQYRIPLAPFESKEDVGRFVDVTPVVGADTFNTAGGAIVDDLDNDGFLDFYLGTGSPSYAVLVPNVLFRNHDGKSFVDVTASSGTGCLHKGHGVAFADIDNDGDEDIFIQMGGMMPGDRHANLLFRNHGHGNHWISLRLVGVKTNRGAIGARIKLGVQTPGGGRRFIHRLVGSGGSFGGSPLEQHIGLGKAARIETLEIWWPTSDTRQVFRNVGVNQFLEIRESEKTFTAVERPSFSLGEESRRHPTRREPPLSPSPRVE